MDYDEAYARTRHVFGSEPDPILVQFHHEIDRSQTLLDIGAGQGRHTLFLARQGYCVEAIDPSRVAVEAVAARAAAEGLTVSTLHADFAAPELEARTYGAVLVFGLLQILRWEQIEVLVDRVRSWLAPRGLVFITAFSTADPACRKCSESWSRIGRNSFADEGGEVRTFLAPGQILSLFPNLQALHHFEGMGPWHRHAEGQPSERHVMVEAVLQAPSRTNERLRR